MRIDHQLAKQWIEPNSRVLDLGCGDGELLAHLQEKYGVSAYGIEMDGEQINHAIAKGVNIIEQDLNEGLANFADNSFDTVLMTRALQAVKEPDVLLLDMLRVGKQVVVTFPNFAHWHNRMYLGVNGLMPVSETLPYKWFDTPNIHLCTFNDFENLCKAHDITILECVAVSEDAVVEGVKNIATIADDKIQKVQTKYNLHRSNIDSLTKSLRLDTSALFTNFGKLEELSRTASIKKIVHEKLDNFVSQSPNILADIAIFRVSK